MFNTYFLTYFLHNLFFLPEILLIINSSLFILLQIFVLKQNTQIKSLKFSRYFFAFVLLNYLFLVQTNFDSIFLGFNSNLILNSNLNLIKILIVFFTLILNYFSYLNLKSNLIFKFEFYSILIIAFISSILLINCTNFFAFFFILELNSICLYILVSIKNDSILVLESALKYFLIGSITSILTLIGIFFILIFFKSVFFFEILLKFQNTNNFFLVLPFYFFFSIIFFKLGIFPFNFQVPDIYQTSLTLIVYFISIISKLSLVFFLIYFFTFNFFDFINIFFFYPFLIITLILGAIKGLIQTNLKRIFAYSSFIHLSFILLSLFYLPVILNNQTFYSKNFNQILLNELNSFNFNLEQKVKIATLSITLLYLFVYVFLNFLFFSFLLVYKKVHYNFEEKEFKSTFDFINLDNTNNLISYYLVTIMLSLIGLPPFAGFFVKYLILYQFVIYNYKITSFFFLFFSLISSFYYFKIIKILYFSKQKNLTHKFYNLILINNSKNLINYKTNNIVLYLLLFINLMFNFGFPFFFIKIFRVCLNVVLQFYLF